MAAPTLDLDADAAEMATAAVELCNDIAEHIPHRAHFESIELVRHVAEALGRIAERRHPMAEQESFLAIRRVDGLPIFDEYAWMPATEGPDPWDGWRHEDDTEDGPVEYELCRLEVRPVSRRRYSGEDEFAETPSPEPPAAVPSPEELAEWPARPPLEELLAGTEFDGFIPGPAPEPPAEVDPWEHLRHTISCRTAWCKTCHAAVAALDAHDAEAKR